ncbi:MAG: acyl-CoA thioesterase [Planctomycetes bacterium]|nr:acyl-CoA thioesterase [Planctomycetota bacterium]
MKTHEIKTRVRYQETDQMGVVYYANFFVYFEMGRTEFLRHMGMPYSEMEKEQIFFPVTETYCKFRSPARYDDVLIIQTWISEMKHATVEFSYKIIREEDQRLVRLPQRQPKADLTAGKVEEPRIIKFAYS